MGFSSQLITVRSRPNKSPRCLVAFIVIALSALRARLSRGQHTLESFSYVIGMNLSCVAWDKNTAGRYCCVLSVNRKQVQPMCLLF